MKDKGLKEPRNERRSKKGNKAGMAGGAEQFVASHCGNGGPSNHEGLCIPPSNSEVTIYKRAVPMSIGEPVTEAMKELNLDKHNSSSSEDAGDTSDEFLTGADQSPLELSPPVVGEPLGAYSQCN